MATNTPKSDVPSPRDTRAKVISSLGGMPPKKTVSEIMKVNEPRARGAAPDAFAPATK